MRVENKTYEMDVYCEVPTIRVRAKNKREARKKIMAKLKKLSVSKIVDKKAVSVEESIGYYY